MGKVNIDFTPTKYNADDAPDLVTGAYNQSMDDLKTALDNATAEDSGGGGVTYPIPIDKGGTGANNAEQARKNLGIVDPTPVYVETEETSEPGLHIIVDSENNVLKIKKV